MWECILSTKFGGNIGGGVAAAISFGRHQKRANERAIREALELATKDRTQREQE